MRSGIDQRLLPVEDVLKLRVLQALFQVSRQAAAIVGVSVGRLAGGPTPGDAFVWCLKGRSCWFLSSL